MISLELHCIYCEASEEIVPLLPFKFKGKEYWICPQHLPILIHKPQELVGKVPDIENYNPDNAG